MDSDDIPRRLRGIFGMGLVWAGAGVVLSVLAGVVFTLLNLVGVVTGGPSLGDVAFLAVRAAIVFGVAGAGFSTLVSLFLRGRKLSDLSWVRFALGGGLAAGIGVPLFLQLMNILSGDGMVDWSLVLDDARLMAVLGAVTAGGSLKAAQMAGKALPAGQEAEADLLSAEDPRALDGGSEGG